MMFLRCLFFLILILPLGLYAESDSIQQVDSYPIILEKPDVVGQSFRIESVVNRKIRSVTRRANGKIEEESIDLSTEFEADVRVLKINAKGSASLIEATILRMVSKDPTRPKIDILSPKTKIVASVKNGKTCFAAEGFTMTNVQSEELRLFLTLANGNMNDQLVFGSTLPRKVGETWTPNLFAAAKLLGNDLNFPPNKIKGKVLFKSLDSGIAIIDAEVRAVNVPVDFRVTAVKSAIVDVQMTQKSKIPIIPSSKGCYDEKSMVRLSVTIDALDDNGTRFTTKQTTTIDQQALMYTP